MGDAAARSDLSAVPAQKIAETRGNLVEMREALTTPEDRVEGAGKLQREAESSYAAQRYALALRTQLTALWLLAPGEPALPRSLADPATPGLAALQSVIGKEDAAATLPPTTLPPTRTAEEAAESQKAELRLALLLDLANTALCLEVWPVARLACDTVRGLNPRARSQSWPRPPGLSLNLRSRPQSRPEPRPQAQAQALTQAQTQAVAVAQAQALTQAQAPAPALTRCWRASPTTPRRAIGWRRRTTARAIHAGR